MPKLALGASMIGRKSVLFSVSVIAILVASSIFVAFPATPRVEAQAQLPREQRNWEMGNHDALGSNFNPQTQITKDNVPLLELKWMFPIPSISAAGDAVKVGEGFFGLTLLEGTTTPPIIVDGIVYLVTNYYNVIALDAGTGKVVWNYQYQANVNDAQKRLPIGGAAGHIHAFYYIDGNIIFPGVMCDVVAINALTGKLSWKLENYCADIPGNAGFYGALFSYPPVLYKKGNILIVAPPVVDGLTGRGFVAGYDVTTRQLKWRFFTVPPAGGDPDWAVKVRDKIWIQGIKGTDIPVELLKNDWGNLGTVQFEGKGPGGATIKQTLTRAGMGTVWGQMAVDEEKGIVYLGLDQPTADWNATYRPGPNLFSDSVMALNANTGELIWAHQTTTHDLYDWDCSWNTVLGNIGSKKVVFKGCKNGILYAFDAATGEIIWYFNPPAIKRTEWTPFHAASKLNSGPKDNSIIGNWDPRNPDTFKRPWQNWPSKDTFWQNPPASGGIESDIAYDGKSVFVATYNLPGYMKAAPTEGYLIFGADFLPAPAAVPNNSTIYAVDAATGKPKWNFFIEGSGYRGGLTVSGGVVYAGVPDGNMYALDAETGKVIFQKFFGSRLNIPPTIGATADGKIRIFQVIGGAAANGFGYGQPVPGALMVFGIPDKLPEPQAVTKEMIKQAPKEVIKAAAVEAGVVQTVEVISPLSYAAVGVAVVLVVIAGLLFSRRKKA